MRRLLLVALVLCLCAPGRALAADPVNIAPLAVGGGSINGVTDPTAVICNMIDENLSTAYSGRDAYTRSLQGVWDIGEVRICTSSGSNYRYYEARIGTVSDGITTWSDPITIVGITRQWYTWQIARPAVSAVLIETKLISGGGGTLGLSEWEIWATEGSALVVTGVPTANHVALSWPATGGPYAIHRDGVLLDTTTAITYQDAAYPPGQSVTYTVTDAAEVTGSVQVYTVPAAPVVTVTGTTTSTTSLSWPTVATASSYQVYRDGALIMATGNTSYTDGNLSPATGFIYRVAAVNVSGPGRLSEPVLAETLEQPPPPAAPQNLRLLDRLPTSLAVAWDPVAGVAGYKIYLNGSLYSLTGGTAYTITGLTAGTTYRVAVQAYTGPYDGALSATLEARTVGAPGAPVDLSAIPAGRSCALSWAANPSGDPATGYRVRVAGELVYEGTETGATVRNLTPATEYSFQVSGYNTAGEGPPATISVTMPDGQTPPAVTGLTWASTVRTISISWDVSEDVIGYAVTIAGEVVYEGPATNSRGAGLVPATAYDIQVCAVNEFGAGEPATVVATTKGGEPRILSLVAYDTGYIAIWTGPQGVDAPDAYQVLVDGVLAGDATGHRWEDTARGWQTGETHDITIRAIYAGVPADVTGTVTAYVAADPVEIPPSLDLVEALLRQWAPLFVVVVGLGFAWMTWDFFRGGPYH